MIRAHRGDLSRPRRTSLFTAAALAPAGFPASALAEDDGGVCAGLILQGRARPPAQRRRGAGLDGRRHLFRGRHGRHAGAHAPRAPSRRTRERAPRSRRSRPGSIAPCTCCCRSRRCSWSGLPPTTSRRSSATRPSSRRPRSRGACSHSAPGLRPTRRARMDDAVEALRARGEGFTMALTHARRAATSRPKAAPSAAARCCASRT